MRLQTLNIAFVNLINRDVNRRILRGLTTVAFFLVIGKMAGALKEVAIAYRYGISEILDVYLIGFLIVAWIPGIWTAILQSTYIPLVNGLSNEERGKFEAQFHAVAISLSVFFTLLVPIVALVFADRFTGSLSPSASEALLKTILIMSPATGFSLLVGVYNIQLLSRERHVNTLLETVPALFIMLAMLLPINHMTTTTLSISTVVGIAVQCSALVFVLTHSNSWVLPQLSLNSKAWKELGNYVGILTLSTVIMSFVDPIGTYIAAKLGAGNVAGLSYSNRILMLFLTLGAISISRSILPVLSDVSLSAKEKLAVAMNWTYILFGLGLAASLVCWFLTPTLVNILFERGEFTPNDSAAVAEAVRFGLFQLPIYFAGTVLVQLCASLKLYVPILITSVIAVIVKTVFSYILAKHFAFAGVALATVPMYFATTLFLIFYLSHAKKNIVLRG